MLPKYEKSMMAQLRSGILPLRIETGRFSRTPLEQRICELCNMGALEDEIHVLCVCPLYNEERAIFYNNITRVHPHFQILNTEDKFFHIMKTNQKECAKFTWRCFNIRKNKLYKENN